MSDRVTWGEHAYAGFWLRVAARLIDWVLVGTVTSIVAAIVGLLLGFGALVAEEAGALGVGAAVTLGVLFGLVLLLPDLLYDCIMTSRFGWTLGKRAVGIEVRRSDGSLLSFAQALGRYFGRILSSIPLYLGFLWAAWDERKQTWHDKLVDCYVLQSAALAPRGATPAPRPAQIGWGIPGSGLARGEDPGAAQSDSPPFQQPMASTEQPPAVQRTPEASWGDAAGPAGDSTGTAPSAGEPGSMTGRTPAEESEPHGDEPADDEPADWTRELQWDSGPEPAGDAAAGQRAASEPPDAVGSGSGEGDAPEAEDWSASEPDAEHAPGAEDWSGSGPTSELAPDEGRDGAPASDEERVGEPTAVDRHDEEAPRSGGGTFLGGDSLEEARWASVGATPDEGGAPSGATIQEPPATPPERRAGDPNLAAIERAGLDADTRAWLEQVADQVDMRLDRVNPAWRTAPQAEAARACAFGLLLGHLSRIYPHVERELSLVAEAHPSYSTLLAGSRLATLQQIVADPARATAWLGPLIDVRDRAQVGRLLE